MRDRGGLARQIQVAWFSCFIRFTDREHVTCEEVESHMAKFVRLVPVRHHLAGEESRKQLFA